MATHQASINIQELTKFKLEATRTRVEYHFHLEPNSKQAIVLWEDSARRGREGEICHAVDPIYYFAYFSRHVTSGPI